MEDFILREIDRLGEMLMMIARRLGLMGENVPDYSVTDVKEEFDKASLPLDLESILQLQNPIWHLVENKKLSDQGLETLIEILFHSDIDENKKTALLDDALTYLDGKGYYSFKLHSLSNS